MLVNTDKCGFPQKGLEGEDDGAISMLSDNTAKLTSAVR